MGTFNVIKLQIFVCQDVIIITIIVIIIILSSAILIEQKNIFLQF